MNFTKPYQINLIAGNKTTRGPGKVYQNLSKGLSLLGHKVNKPIVGEPDLNICLQMMPGIESLDPSKTLFGPNLVVLPSEAPALFSDPSRHFLVPSKWVKDLYCQFDFVHPDNLHVWAVGIDIENWRSINKVYMQDCFIYFKNRSQEDLHIVKLLMKKMNMKYSVIEYGQYTEQELKEACRKSKFAVLLTGTESQGIAYMEILSTNTPCYVFNKTYWKTENGNHNCPATSVPYFDDGFCGRVSPDHVSIDHFSEFVNSLSTFVPSFWVGIYSLEHAADDILEIAKNANLV